jgi:hypothetical protein
MQTEELFATVFVIGMFAGVFIVFLGLRQRSQQLEMRHRERMAMIERGQIPLAEPTGGAPGRYIDRGAAPSARSLSLGIIIVGLGLSLMTIIAIAGESPKAGIGVGGAIAILGGAFIVRSLLVPTVDRSSIPPAPPVSRSDDAI